MLNPLAKNPCRRWLTRAGRTSSFNRQLQRWLVIAAALVFVTALSWHSAKADDVKINRPFVGKRPILLDLHAGINPWGYGFGLSLGARVSIPIVHNGFVKSINNAVHITTGADVGYFHYNPCRGVPASCEAYNAMNLFIPVMLNWEFYFTNKWSAFGELGVGIYPHFRPSEWGGVYWPFAWVVGGVGGRFHINNRVALVLRLSSPYPTFGATIKF